MKHYQWLLATLLLFALHTAAQDQSTYWRKHLKTGLSVNQASFSSNWTGGGVNSIGLNTYVNYKPNWEKGKTTWNNEIDLIYGFQNNEGQGFRKTNDRIYLDTKFGRKIGKKWNVYFSMNFLTQFDQGFKFDQEIDSAVVEDVKVSSFMSPGYLTIGLGFEFKPVNYFFLRLSPFSPRFTFVTDSELVEGQVFNYGVEPGKNVRQEWTAFQFLFDFDKEIAKNLNLKAKYLGFWSYERPISEMVHRLEALFSAKVNKLLQVDLGGQLIYDIDQIDEVQYSQIFALTLVYEFKNFTDDK